jgi:hypothetical protein
MAMTEDFTVFFNTAEFAVDVVHTPAGGSAAPAAPAIFDANGAVVESMGVATSGPAVVVPVGTWPAIAEGDALAIGAATYVVRSVLAVDDGALAVLALARTN